MNNNVAHVSDNVDGDTYRVVWCKIINATLPQFAALQCHEKHFLADRTAVFTVRHKNGLTINVRISDLLKRPDGGTNPSGLTSKEYTVSWDNSIVAMSAEEAAAECFAKYFVPSETVSLSVTDSAGHSELFNIGDLTLDRS